ncbi:MAG: hypothetical protein IPO77_05280 [Acidobacteria bacterium]|nr:hypothetical protein [Acidobacteriota bacterium]
MLPGQADKVTSDRSLQLKDSSRAAAFHTGPEETVRPTSGANRFAVPSHARADYSLSVTDILGAYNR